jgi:enoyl-CoA hydratase/carnithine racemase
MSENNGAGVEVAVHGGVATITLNRPWARNAIGLATIGEFARAIDALDSAEISVVAIRGAGDKAFVSGADLKETATLRTRPLASEMARSMRRALDSLAELAVPVIAVLNGHAIGGGGEVAIACDFRLAADDTKIGFTQSRLAIMPAWGGCERLAEIVGRGRALFLATSGQLLDANDAFVFGLVDRVFPRAAFETETAEILARLGALPPTATRSIKRTIAAVRPASHRHLETGAIDAFTDLWVGQDHWNLVDALLARPATTTLPPRAST